MQSFTGTCFYLDEYMEPHDAMLNKAMDCTKCPIYGDKGNF